MPSCCPLRENSFILPPNASLACSPVAAAQNAFSFNHAVATRNTQWTFIILLVVERAHNANGCLQFGCLLATEVSHSIQITTGG